MPLLMKRTAISYFLALAAALPAHAAEADISKPMPLAPPRKAISATSLPPKILEFALWKSSILVNDTVGLLNEGLFCGNKYTLRYSKKIDEWMTSLFVRAFKDEALKAGYAYYDGSQSVFEQKGSSGADFRLGATLQNLDYRSCGTTDVKGGAYASIRWELFSARRQKVVYAATIEGSFLIDSTMPERDFDKNLSLIHI